ncbi:hypothetical protein BC826DRAFT_441506 [Russula brevipes]|nr:hypothetical protein BC826DRAFT_441506 [Russula brevipes]
MTTTMLPPTTPPASPHFRVPLTDRFNYASLDCSARVHTAHRGAKSAANILSSKRDRYMLSPCGAAPQFVVVELCDDIRIDTVQLANSSSSAACFGSLRSASLRRTLLLALRAGPSWGRTSGRTCVGCSRSIPRRPFATFIGTFASTCTRITQTSTTVPSPFFAFMALRTSSSGSGTPGKKKVRRGRT